MNCPKVTVIILNWNGVEDTVECLDSLKKITYPNYSVIVVDNASSGEDVRILGEQYCDYIEMVANEQNYGTAKGFNIGIKKALSQDTDYLLILNNDVIVDCEFLSKLVEVAERDPLIGILGSKVSYYHRPGIIQTAGVKMRWRLGLMETYYDEEDTGQYDTIAVRDFVYGISFLTKKSVIEKIGLFDEYFFCGYEDMEYCARAQRADFKVVYVPESIVWHKAGISKAKLSQTFKEARLPKQEKGISDYKYFYRIFRARFGAITGNIPFLMYFTGIGPLLFFLWKKDWQTIKRGFTGRLRYVFKIIRGT